jgi:hypothetical protein
MFGSLIARRLRARPELCPARTIILMEPNRANAKGAMQWEGK